MCKQSGKKQKTRGMHVKRIANVVGDLKYNNCQEKQKSQSSCSQAINDVIIQSNIEKYK